MNIGIDVGTSEVKVVLVDEADRIVASASRRLSISRPRPTWSEQDPESWWAAAAEALDELAATAPRPMSAVRSIGLSGQMHGAVLLADDDRALRPAILWNDGRSAAECRELERRCPDIAAITGNVAMPGFTAPKLLWLGNHEPDVFRQVRTVLLPKDYVRLCLTGERVTDTSDASGTLWLDTSRRVWSEKMLAATALELRQMPRLVEGPEVSAELRPPLAERWGIAGRVVVAGGGADNAASAMGIGCVRAGQGLVSLGTSGVILVASSEFKSNPQDAVHSFCHCLPSRWYQMSVTLSATASLDWLANLLGTTAGALVSEAANANAVDAPIFLPYLSGERTPHNDPDATGVFFGLRHGHDRAALGYAVAEGVAFALADGLAALLKAGSDPEELVLLGGGARSAWWASLLASVLRRSLRRMPDHSHGAALGAARLGWLAAGQATVEQVCTPARSDDRIEPDDGMTERLQRRLGIFRELYPSLRRATGLMDAEARRSS
jgi:xylulokinase